MGKQAKKKDPSAGSGSGRGEKPYKKRPKVFDQTKRRLVTREA
jgi:hypothetical protein